MVLLVLHVATLYLLSLVPVVCQSASSLRWIEFLAHLISVSFLFCLLLWSCLWVLGEPAATRASLGLLLRSSFFGSIADVSILVFFLCWVSSGSWLHLSEDVSSRCLSVTLCQGSSQPVRAVDNQG